MSLLSCPSFQQHPRLPLFPYTTLFRSQSGFEGIVAKRCSSIYEPGRRSPHWLKIKAEQTAEFVVGGYTAGKGSRQRLDRKSTRLNSSHANISYAGFCLKKKQLLTATTI